MSVDSSGHIINEVGPKDNPREEEYFEYQTKFTNPLDFCTHVAWSIYGDVPKGISIDIGSGKISGTLKWFHDQPSCQDNNPCEEMEYDGSNWMKDGRFKHNSYDFHFTIQRDILMLDANNVCDTPVTETNNVYITLVKCNNINNDIFIKRYLESTKTSKENERTKINVNGEVYMDYASAKAAMPGPFTCSPK
jgi:hypothetical protein